MQTAIILCGQEGTGKSTLAKMMVPMLKSGAAFDAENILQVNPFEFNDAFKALAIKNSVALIHNFFDAGFETVVAGSFINDRHGYDAFRALLKGTPKIYILMLGASKAVRDERRISRAKPTTKEWRDELDKKYPPDTTLRDLESSGDYKYVEIDNSGLNTLETFDRIRAAVPEVFTH